MECENCPWKDRDPKKLDTWINKFVKELADLKALVQTIDKRQFELGEQIKDLAYEMRGGQQRRLPVDPLVEDEIPF